VLWRRIAGGLEQAAQERLFEAVLPALRPAEGKRGPGGRVDAPDEMIRLAGSLERIDPSAKVEAGEWILQRVEKDGPAAHLLWALGRLGARVPFHGSGHACVPARTAEEWIARLLALPASRSDLAFPLTQLVRRSGDRARDVDDGPRAEVLAALREAGAPDEMVRSVREVVMASVEEESRIFGESLPPGLRVVEVAGEGEAASVP
jgi:hypothetical protein